MSTAKARYGAPAHPTWREWTGLALLALPLFMIATDFTAMFMVLPSVTADLAPSTTQMLWIMHVGEFVAAGLLITMGRLTDKIGRFRLLMLAMVLYGTASALAAFAPNPETLMGARVLIGASAAAASPAAISMVRSIFTHARYYGVAFATLMGALSAGAALGPPIGGLLLEYFWWGSVFLINVPVALLVLLAGPWLLPRTVATTGGRIDVISVALSMAAVLLVIFGAQEIADRGVSPAYVLSVAAGLVLGGLFLRRQQSLEDPLLDLSLFSIRPLRMAATVFVIASMGFVAVDFILVQYLQIVIGVPIARLGLFLAIPGVAAILGTALTPVLGRWMRPSHVMAAGGAVIVAGAAIIVTTTLYAPGVTALFIVGTTMVGFGYSPLIVLGSQLIVTSAPADRAGSAVAVQDISAKLGGALGMAVLGSLSMAVFSRTLRTGTPESVSEAQLDAATQSPGGAVAVAENIGGTTGHELLAAVHDAWSMGTLAAYTTAIALGIVMIVLILRGLRGVELPSTTDQSDPELGVGHEEPNPGLSERTAAAPPEPGSARPNSEAATP